MWLGQVFAELGCQAVPAMHCRQALAVARQLPLPISTIVVDPELPGAARMVQRLLEANPATRTILIRNPADNRKATGIQALGALERPSPWEAISREQWLERVRRILAQP